MMYALVRFLEDGDKRRHVVRAEDVRNFNPVNDRDFDKKAVYTVHWTDEVDGENTGDYPAQILRLGVTEQEAREAPKRISAPRINFDDSCEVDMAPKRNTEAKVKKSNQMSAKKESYEAILKAQTVHAHQKNSQGVRKRWASTSTSDSDDTLVSKEELLQQKKKKKYWKERCGDLQAHNTFLQEQLKQLQSILQTKILRLDEERPNKAMPARGYTSFASPSLSSKDMEVDQTITAQPSRLCSVVSAEPSPTVQPTTEREPSSAEHQGLEDFAYSSDGSFHLQKGIFLSPVQAKRILNHVKASLVIKETAQAIWTQAGLAARSVKGVVAPCRKHLGDLPKPPLTPEKVGVLEATLTYWSRRKNIDATAALSNLTNILSEKIQDCVKAQRRKAQ